MWEEQSLGTEDQEYSFRFAVLRCLLGNIKVDINRRISDCDG